MIEKIKIPDLKGTEDLVVVIDVIRAFTTAAYAFANKAKQIVLVEDIKEAFELHKKHPDWLLMGENGGGIPGFHLGNSPLDVFKAPIAGKTLIQRTSCGTKGVCKAKNARKILVSSFVVAEATLQRIAEIKPLKTTFLITAHSQGDEDWALADYLEDKMRLKSVCSSHYLEKVRKSSCGITFCTPEFPKEELDAICDVNRFGFAMEVFQEDQLLILKPVTNTGELFYFI